MSWGCEETGRVQAVSSTQSSVAMGHWELCLHWEQLPLCPRGKSTKPRLFPRNYFPYEWGQWKLSGFCFLGACPLPLVRACDDPAQPLAPVLMLLVMGQGPLALLPKSCWTWSSQPPGKFMPILVREWQEVSRQESIGFRHIPEGNNKEECSCS